MLTKVVNGERVVLSAEEEREVVAQWKLDTERNEADKEISRKEMRFARLKEEILTAHALGATPDQTKVDELKALSEELR